MLVQTEHRFSVKDYYRMAETGVLRPDARVELLDGRIIDMSPIGPYHGGLVKRLIRVLNAKSKARWMISAQDPLRLDEYSEPEPDIMLLKPAADDYTNRHPEPRDVFLLIEVSDTSIGYDQGQKLPAYGRAGVPEVWLLNLNEEIVEVYREPNFTGYASRSILQKGQQASPQAFPDVTIDVAELLKR